ncbi:hypothetical protein [Amycolatopsis sp. CA-128772]|uniref:hypothetical protein n=1 Tax=Amycolatopsis sp. CA-128772 TaxID=2073159 RepID=UPI0018EA5C23|nr:hypothetical protein [Amycolatopsis sp. CA-128772]
MPLPATGTGRGSASARTAEAGQAGTGRPRPSTGLPTPAVTVWTRIGKFSASVSRSHRVPVAPGNDAVARPGTPAMPNCLLPLPFAVFPAGAGPAANQVSTTVARAPAATGSRHLGIGQS